MVRRWQKIAIESRKRIALPLPKSITSSSRSSSSSEEADHPCSTTSPPRVKRGHFVVYTADKQRFMIPLTYLHNEIFIELLEAAEEQFGSQRDGPITLLCNSLFMEYVLSVMQSNGGAEHLKKALVTSIRHGHWLSSSHLPPQNQTNQCQMLICSF
ncbi:hypothetical protein Dimus_026147 [Dionaea muscipula]